MGRLPGGLRGLAAVEWRVGNIGRALDRLEQAMAVYKDVYGFDHHPARKAVEVTYDLLSALRERAGDSMSADGERRLGLEAPPVKQATDRYRGQKLAIGNQARGFGREAEAVTALRLGDDLLELQALDWSLASYDSSVRLAEPDSLLELSARVRRARAKARRNVVEARREYEAILKAADRQGATDDTSWVRSIRARVQRELEELAEERRPEPDR